MKKLLLLATLALLGFKAFAFFGLIATAVGASQVDELNDRLKETTSGLQAITVKVDSDSIMLIETASKLLGSPVKYLHIFNDNSSDVVAESEPTDAGVVGVKTLYQGNDNDLVKYDDEKIYSLARSFNSDVMADLINDGKDLKLLSVSKKKITAYYSILE